MGNGQFPGQDQHKHLPSYKWGCGKGAKHGNTRSPVYKYRGRSVPGKSKPRFQWKVESFIRRNSQLKGVCGGGVGGWSPMLKVEKSYNDQRKRGRRFMEMWDLSGLEIRNIYQGLLGENSIGWIYIAEVLTALESESDWPENTEYFYMDK